MPRPTRRLLSLAVLAAPLVACEKAEQPVEEGTGPAPRLPPPRSGWIPTVNVAPARGWPDGAMPAPAQGLRVTPFATGLDHPRWLHVLPDGGVLVAESNAPDRPLDRQGLRNRIMGLLMARAGAGVPSADRITLLRDADGDGVAETRSVLLAGLHSPFGMALVGQDLFIANTDAVLRFPWHPRAVRITEAGAPVAELPAGPRNHHWTKSLVASPDGRRLYAGIGSNSNAAENGIEAEQGRAAIWEIDPRSGATRVFASGLRNPVGLDFEPRSGRLWVAVNERDELGSDLVPDYMTAVQAGGFYGWPYSYYGRHVDARVAPQRPDLVARAIVPDYALGPHTASLGLAFARGAAALPPRFAEGVFIGQHGSWNRRPPSGYRVVFVPFDGGMPAGPPVEVLTGFLDRDSHALGRPVGVAMDRDGALLVADDVGNAVWRVTAG